MKSLGTLPVLVVFALIAAALARPTPRQPAVAGVLARRDPQQPAQGRNDKNNDALLFPGNYFALGGQPAPAPAGGLARRDPQQPAQGPNNKNTNSDAAPMPANPLKYGTPAAAGPSTDNNNNNNNTPAPALTTLPLVSSSVANPLTGAYWPVHFTPGTSASHALTLPAPTESHTGGHLQIWLRGDCAARPRLALGNDATKSRLIAYATPLACSETDKVEVVEYRVPLAKDQMWSSVAVGVEPRDELVGKQVTVWVRAAVVDGPAPDPALQLTGPHTLTPLSASTLCTHSGLRLAILSALRPANLARAHAGVLHAEGAAGRVWVGGWDDPGLGIKPAQVLRAGSGKDLGKDGLAGMAVLEYLQREVGDGLYALCQTY